jgi:type VI secretion system protein ImpK
MSLGFQGRYRLSPRGPAELDRLREETYAVIKRQRQAPEADLSPHWRGLAAPYRGARMVVPVWVAASAAAAVLAALYVWLSMSLGAAADDAFARMLRAPPAAMPQIARAAPVTPPAPGPLPKAVDQLCKFLQPEVDQGLVTVVCNPTTSVVRIKNRGMFASGSATLEPRFVPVLQQIATELQHEKGQIEVVGYTDNQPIHTLRFPSNFELSSARAEAARGVLGQTVSDASRLSAEGRGEADPIASNKTPEGREENRRIEVVLHRPS